MDFKTLLVLLKNVRSHAYGRCYICGRLTVFFTIPSEWGHVRESMGCRWCWSNSRKRHIVKQVLDLFAPQSKSLYEARQALSKVSIYSASSNDYFHRLLGANNSNFTCSEYFPGVKEGDHRNGVMCQNLEKLTFEDERFDLVITEDVFEHVRRPMTAFEEVGRVLKAGGYHVFTVPCFFDRRTLARVDTTTDQDMHLLPAVYHGDSLRDGILVYTDFGYDLLDALGSLGFNTHVSFSLYRDAIKFGIADSYVFVSRKVNKAGEAERTDSDLLATISATARAASGRRVS